MECERLWGMEPGSLLGSERMGRMLGWYRIHREHEVYKAAGKEGDFWKALSAGAERDERDHSKLPALMAELIAKAKEDA